MVPLMARSAAHFLDRNFSFLKPSCYAPYCLMGRTTPSHHPEKRIRRRSTAVGLPAGRPARSRAHWAGWAGKARPALSAPKLHERGIERLQETRSIGLAERWRAAAHPIGPSAQIGHNRTGGNCAAD